MISKIYVLVDWTTTEEYFIAKDLTERGYNAETLGIKNFLLKDRIKKYRYPIMIFKFLQLTYQVLKKSKRDDLIICVSFTLGFCCTLIRFLLYKKNPIICLNIIAHRNKSLVGKLRKLLYSFFLNKEKIFISVNSLQLIDEYQADFGISRERAFFLPDRVSSKHEKRDFQPGQRYIFCGGEAQRDWNSLFKACSNLSDLQFVCVARKITFDNSLRIPSNVRMFFDIKETEFYELLKSAAIQVIPLMSIRPCGLIVMIRGALLSVPVIATRTPSIENYIEDGISGFLVKQFDYLELEAKIRTLFLDLDLQKRFAETLISSIETKFGEESYMNRLVSVIQKIE